MSDEDAVEFRDDPAAALLAQDLDRLNELKLEKKALDDEIEIIQAAITKQMKADDMSDITFYDRRGNPTKATFVQGSTRSWDLKAMSEADQRIYDAVIKVSVDTKRWDRAAKMGLLTPEVMATLTERPNKPYVLFSDPLKEETTNE